MERYSLPGALLGALTLLFVAQGCGDDDNENPAPPVNTAGANSNAGSANQSGSGNSGGDGPQGGEPNGGTSSGGTSSGGTGANAGTGGNGGSGGSIPNDCPLVEFEDWLNQPSESDSVPFDNAARLPLLEDDGSLPPLDN